MLKVALIGSNGFIGRHLASELSRQPGCEVVRFGRAEKSPGPGNYFQLQSDEGKSLGAQLKGCDLLYYLASETIPASSWNDPRSEIEKNLLPFISVMEAAVKSGVRKIVFLSSAGTIYGRSRIKITEDSNKMPFSPYGITKLNMEYFLNYYRVRSGLQYEVFRISNVFGEGQDTSKGLGVINTFLEQIVKGEKVRVFGDGRHTRNYIYVQDVARLLTLPLQTPIGETGTFNLSSPYTLSINEIVELLKKVIPERIVVEHLEGRASDNEFIDLDNARLMSKAAKFQFIPIEQAILLTYQHIKKELKITHP